MAGLVVDTHALVWYLLGSPRLSANAARAIDGALAAGDAVRIAAVTLVEVIYLVEKGRLPEIARTRLAGLLDDPDSGLVLAPLDRQVADAVARIGRDRVPDMPDRIIAATALYLQGVLVLTDLDLIDCPPTLLRDWLAGQGAPPGLLVRVAVRTIESWVLADHEAMRGLIGPKVALPECPDNLRNPKQHLLKLAQHGPRHVRLDLVKEAGAIASQGIGYNARPTEWVSSTWSPERAAKRSPSLQRTRTRLRERNAHLPVGA